MLMLREATISDVRAYADFVYTLALDPQRSGYPTYADGIKTKKDFLADAEKALSDENSELLLYSRQGRVEGWLSYFRIPEDRYVQLTGCNIRTGTAEALAEFLARLEAKFPGDTAYFGFPGENREAADFLMAQNFICLERDWNHSFLFADDHSRKCTGKVERVTRENFSRFRAIYHPDADTYWNSDRIYEDLEDWRIYLSIRNGDPAGTIFLTGKNDYYEIFGIVFAKNSLDETVFSDLLISAWNECKRQGAKYLTYFSAEAEKPILESLGFQCVGEYVLFSRIL